MDQLLATTDTDSLPHLSQYYYIMMKSPIFEVSRFLKSGRNLRVCCGVAAVVLLLVRSPQCRVRGRAVVVRRYGGFSAQSCSDTGPRHIFSVPTPAPSHLHHSRDTRDVRPSWRHQTLCSLTVLCRSPHTLAILNRI